MKINPTSIPPSIRPSLTPSVLPGSVRLPDTPIASMDGSIVSESENYMRKGGKF